MLNSLNSTGNRSYYYELLLLAKWKQSHSVKFLFSFFRHSLIWCVTKRYMELCLHLCSSLGL